MARAAERVRWDHTAAIVATIHNSQIVEGDPVDPKSINPYRRDGEDDDADSNGEAKPILWPVSILKDVFCREEGRRQ